MKRGRGDRRILCWLWWQNWVIVELWGVEGWDGRTQNPLCAAWNIPWRSSSGTLCWEVANSRVPGLEPLSRNWDEWDDACGASTEVCVGLKPQTPIFHTPPTPRGWMDWHKVPLLKCPCLKAPKISLNQFRALLAPIKPVVLTFGAVTFRAEDFGWRVNVNAVTGRLQFALYSSKPRDGCWYPQRTTGTVKNFHCGMWLLQTVTQLPFSAALDVAKFVTLSRCESKRILRGQELLNFFFLPVYLHERGRIPASLCYLKELEQLDRLFDGSFEPVSLKQEQFVLQRALLGRASPISTLFSPATIAVFREISAVYCREIIESRRSCAPTTSKSWALQSVHSNIH